MGSGYETKRTVTLLQSVIMGIVIALVVGVVVGFIVANHYEAADNQSGDLPSAAETSSNIDYSDNGGSIDVSKAVSPSVVFISNIVNSNSLYGGFFSFSNGGNSANEDVVSGTGSGVIYSKDGYIVTNNHVVSGADKVRVQLYDGTEYDAKVIGTDAQSDLAVIKIDAKDLTPATFDNSDNIVVGETAIAIGNPGGADFVNSVTQGIISGVNRSVQVSSGQFMTLVQTDAAINPGNSGGALCNGRGKVIGINTIKMAQSGYEGMGFAIPSNTVLDICNQLIEHGKVIRPALQVSIYADITAQMAQYYNLAVDYGIMVQPNPGGSAAKAGLENYDIIIAIDGSKVQDTAELQKYLYQKQIGDTVKITVNREGKELDFDVLLGELQ